MNAPRQGLCQKYDNTVRAQPTFFCSIFDIIFANCSFHCSSQTGHVGVGLVTTQQIPQGLPQPALVQRGVSAMMGIPGVVAPGAQLGALPSAQPGALLPAPPGAPSPITPGIQGEIGPTHCLSVHIRFY